MFKTLDLPKNFSKKIFSLFSLSLFLGAPSEAGILDLNDSELLVQTIINEASKTMGKIVEASDVKWEWGPRSQYDPVRKLISLNKERFKGISLAFVTAHEYAHHVQYSKDGEWKKNTLRTELQADCYAGIILASIPKISFNNDEVRDLLDTAKFVGDDDYDDPDHHGSPENRYLAFLSGLRFGNTTGQYKDKYFKMFCLAK